MGKECPIIYYGNDKCLGMTAEYVRHITGTSGFLNVLVTMVSRMSFEEVLFYRSIGKSWRQTLIVQALLRHRP